MQLLEPVRGLEHLAHHMTGPRGKKRSWLCAYRTQLLMGYALVTNKKISLPVTLLGVYNRAMTSHIDTMRTAQLLLQTHGADAVAYAQAMMQRFIQSDDVKGAAVWLGVIADIETLQNVTVGTIH